ncbi:MAG: PAS domain-containing sensor histidine kinase [Burkholderiales bacterium]|nr:PAS domain-containing sensor histidine kinase [Burkholderiales bacterium]
MGAEPLLPGFEPFDQLASMVAVVAPDGRCLLANSALENVLGVSRRALQRGSLLDWMADPAQLRETLWLVARNQVATSRFDAHLTRMPSGSPELPVHVIVSQTEWPDRVLVEMIEIEQQTRLEREERTHGLAQANKELVRNLAHEIKNPLGGIRGAAQLLAMEVGRPLARADDERGPRGSESEGGPGALSPRELIEYTRIIIQEADRLQALVDRLLAPHRRPQVVADVNIHEVCERVRALILAEFPRGLQVARDYDTSIPEFRGDREQLIQAVLNIAHNATHALAERIAAGDALLALRTRVARQATFSRQRYRLALELHIEDNGPGVPEDIRDRIFHPLISGREGGSGLGLTLAQTFVQQHQGTIECDSVPGRTVFKILIPLPS